VRVEFVAEGMEAIGDLSRCCCAALGLEILRDAVYEVYGAIKGWIEGFQVETIVLGTGFV